MSSSSTLVTHHFLTRDCFGTSCLAMTNEAKSTIPSVTIDINEKALLDLAELALHSSLIGWLFSGWLLARRRFSAGGRPRLINGGTHLL